MWGLTDEDLKNMDAEFITLIKAFDDAFSQTVYSRSSYKYKEVVWGAKFIPMTEYTGNGVILNIDQINNYEKANLPVQQTENS